MSKSGSVASWGALRFAPIVLFGSSMVQAQAPGRPERPSDGPPPIVATTRPVGPLATRTLTAPVGLKAVARSEGTPSPGLRVTLDGSASSGGRLWYRWLQTQGPRVAIDDPTKAEAHFLVPPEATSLEFVLVAGNASGFDASPLTIEVEDPDRRRGQPRFWADAGDEQSSKVGRRGRAQRHPERAPGEDPVPLGPGGGRRRSSGPTKGPPARSSRASRGPINLRWWSPRRAG